MLKETAGTFNWRELNERLVHMTEDEVRALLDVELKVNKRASQIVRLHQRYTTLRAQRERREMLEQAGVHRPEQ